MEIGPSTRCRSRGSTGITSAKRSISRRLHGANRRLERPAGISNSMRFLLIFAAAAGIHAGAQNLPAGTQILKDELPPELRVQRNKGDSVQPVFDGWQRHPDGTISMWFGYYNRNLKEEVSVPVGS